MTDKIPNLIPEAIERRVQHMFWRMFSELGEYIEESVLRGEARADSIRSILFILGLSADTLINRDVLERKLRIAAQDLSEEKREQLEELLGEEIPELSATIIDDWIFETIDKLMVKIERALLAAAAEVSADLGQGVAPKVVGANIRESFRKRAKNIQLQASQVVLSLNADLIEQYARQGNSTHYRWITERDSRVRLWHAALENSIQNWSSPPLGGGTNSGDYGHPGAGLNCRCYALPIKGQGSVPHLTEKEIRQQERVTWAINKSKRR